MAETWGASGPLDGSRFVRQNQGDEIQIVETVDEEEIVPRLRQALFRGRGGSVPGT
jgi:hypothetical protein